MTQSNLRWEIAALGLSNLALRSVPRPTPGPAEVLVQVDAVALNYRDREVAENGMGVPLVFPFVPTSDTVGRVVEAGEGVTRFKVGDRVISVCITGWVDGAPKSWADAPTQGGPIQGMLAQYVATPADWCVRAPNTLKPIEASTLPTAALTAWMALFENGKLRPGQTVVVQGTGGVSLFAVQLAAAAGAHVIVTSSGEDKITRAIRLGASDSINRRSTTEWQQEVLRLTGGRGADHILEMAGGANLARSLKAVVPGGHIWLIGLLEADHITAPILPLLGSRASIVGISVGHRRGLEDLVRMVDYTKLKPVIDAIYPFSQVPESFAHLQRGAFGKIVITVSGQ
jgi:NADPH:quinone reductase-like Zn-dependent oxidoreductase